MARSYGDDATRALGLEGLLPAKVILHGTMGIDRQLPSVPAVLHGNSLHRQISGRIGFLRLHFFISDKELLDSGPCRVFDLYVNSQSGGALHIAAQLFEGIG